MAIELSSFSQLDPAQTTQSYDLYTQLLQEAMPSLSLTRGVFHDLLLYCHAMCDSQIRTGVLDRYLSAQSLLVIESDPTLADTEIVDNVLSNYNIARGAGDTAAGQVTIILSTAINVTIARGAIFTAGSNTYTTLTAFAAKAQAGLISSNTDRLLTPLSDGTWAFTIDVTATAVGVAGIITQNTLILPASPPNSFLTSYATSDFTGGVDPQTNTQLLQLLQQGIAAKAPSNRINMQAMLLARFSAVLQNSIIGAGDVEMIRDQHTIWPGGMGGKCDWYIRTVERLTQLQLSKTAVLLTKNADGSGNWQFSIAKNDAPGFYEITSILPANSPANTTGSLGIVSDTRNVDLTSSATDFIPDIETVAEGAYTRFQTSVVVFSDNVTPITNIAVGATANYNVTVSCLPQIAAIQDYVSGYGVRSYGADILVKAPIPCFVQLNFRIAKNRTQADPNVATIATAVAAAVNQLDFTGRLYAALIHDTVGNYLATGMSIGNIDMLGTIRNPDGTVSFVRNDEVLVVTGITGSMVSDRTVQFFLDPSDVVISISTEIPVST